MKVRLTKYDPRFRRADGSYGRHEWTSFSDVGKTFHNGVLTFEAYLSVEEQFIESITSFFRTADVLQLLIEDLETLQNVPNNQLEGQTTNFSIGQEIDLSQLRIVIKLCLREIAWFRLRGSYQSYLHFGYDYYVYLGANSPTLNSWSPSAGLFAEQLSSPYMNSL